MGDIKNVLDAAVTRSKGASLIIAQKNVGEIAIGVITSLNLKTLFFRAGFKKSVN